MHWSFYTKRLMVLFLLACALKWAFFTAALQEPSSKQAYVNGFSAAHTLVVHWKIGIERRIEAVTSICIASTGTIDKGSYASADIVTHLRQGFWNSRTAWRLSVRCCNGSRHSVDQ